MELKLIGIAGHAVDLGFDIKEALIKHVEEYVATPNGKNAADILWLVEALFMKHGGDDEKEMEARLDELIERLKTTGKLSRE